MYMHVENIYLFMYNYMHWWRFLEPSPFCSLTFYSFSEKEILEKGAYAPGEALRVNQSLRKLEWVQLLMSYACTRVVLWDCSVHLSDHMHSWLMMMDWMGALHLWPCKNCKSIYQPTLCYLVFGYFSHTKYICKDSFKHIPFFILWYSAASATTISQVMVCVH